MISDEDASSSDDDGPQKVYDRGYLRTSEREIRPSTPETGVTEYPLKPDITLYCEKCHMYIDVKTLKDHRAYHKALDTLKYKDDNRPEDIDSLMKRRRLVLKHMKKKMDSENILNPKDIQIVNDAYELLKMEMEDTFEQYRQVKEKIPIASEGMAMVATPKCVLAVGVCSDQNSRWKKLMEDTHTVQDCYGDKEDLLFCGVYDGHNGSYAADIVSEELHHLLLKEMSKFDLSISCDDTLNMSVISDILEDEIQTARSARSSHDDSLGELRHPHTGHMSRAFKNAYSRTDRHFLSLGKDEQSRVRWSGCSACSVVIENTCTDESMLNKLVDYRAARGVIDDEDAKPEPPEEIGLIHLAHAGNVEAVLVRGNRPYKLSKDHTPKNSKEKERIIKKGGSINDSNVDLRVNGILSATRGLGNHGDIALKKCIISNPYTTTVRIDQYAQFLIIATRGVWEIFSDHEAALLLTEFMYKEAAELLPCNEIFDPSHPSTSVNLLLADYNSQMQASMSHLPNLDDGGTVSEMTVPLASEPSRVNTAKKSIQKLSFMDETSEHGDISIIENNQERRSSSPDDEKERVVSLEDSRDKTTPKSRPSTGKSQSSNKQTILSSSSLQRASIMKQASNDLDLQSQRDNMSPGSGNEGDIETMTEFMSIPANSRMSDFPSKDDIRREIAKLLAERLVQAAMLAGAKDNITATVILLPGSKL